MSFKTNMTDLRPRREKYKKEITLPSGGYANREAFPGGKLTVYPWDSNVDTWLQDQARLLPASEQETILYKAVEKLCALNGCSLNDFVIGDVFSVLLVSRSILNDCQIEYTAECPHCSYAEVERIPVEELRVVSPKGPDYAGIDTVTMPDCNDVVVVRPLQIADELAIVTRTPENRGQISDALARILSPVITVNGGQADSKEELFNWFQALSPRDAKFLEKMEDDLTPHLDLSLPHACDKCKKNFDHTLVLNHEFFRSGRFTKS